MSGEEELYDEFGNYIGPDLDSSSDDGDSDDQSRQDPSGGAADDDSVSDRSRQSLTGMDVDSGPVPVHADPQSSIVLHEDKQHYPTASAVYGSGVHTAVIDEDAQALEEPIIAPTKSASFEVVGRSVAFAASQQYVSGLQSLPASQRVVAVCGHLHSGKTTLIDTLISLASDPTGADPADSAGEGDAPRAGPRSCDALTSEKDRGMSLKATACTLPLPDSRGKTYLQTYVSTPGHPQFFDAALAGLRSADAALVVVDAVEGLMCTTEMALSAALAQGLDVVLVINKVDRLILDLHLPPNNAFYKLRSVVDAVNVYVKSKDGEAKLLTPDRGNVVFGSAQGGWFFTCQSFAAKYAPSGLSADDFAKRLWGDCYLDPETRTFKRTAKECGRKGVERTFVEFCLKPVYKVYSAILASSSPAALDKQLRSAGIRLKKKELKMNAQEVVRRAFGLFLANPIPDVVAGFVRDAGVGADLKVTRNWSGPSPRSDGFVAEVVGSHEAEGVGFLSLVRVHSGAAKVGDAVKVLRPGYEEGDDDDCGHAQITGLYLPHGGFRTSVGSVSKGNVCLISGVDGSLSKTGTVVGADVEPEGAFRPLDYYIAGGEATVKLAVEPLNPSELPKLVEGMRKVDKSYGMSRTKVEESGEHLIFGTGELYLDCIMHDLRSRFAGVEVKVADPVVAFQETVSESSRVKCYATTPNKKNVLTFVSEGLEERIGFDAERGRIDLDNWTAKDTAAYFAGGQGWDKLSARSVWCFGPTERGTNLLMDDTLPSEVDKATLGTTRGSIVQGFKWATREGPLCEEPVRGVKCKLLDATLATQPVLRGGGQVIPTVRRAVYSSILTASPRLMEPVYRLQIQCPTEISKEVGPLLSKRRGHVVGETVVGVAGSLVKAYLPVIESFGFETDLRTFTQGAAMSYAIMDHWQVVPGDPLDSSIVLHPLEPSPLQALSREFLVKTRRRKGLGENVGVFKYFDEGVKDELGEEDM